MHYACPRIFDCYETNDISRTEIILKMLLTVSLIYLANAESFQLRLQQILYYEENYKKDGGDFCWNMCDKVGS